MNKTSMNKKWAWIFLAIAAVIVLSVWRYVSHRAPNNTALPNGHSATSTVASVSSGACLDDNEIVSYEMEKPTSNAVTTTITISIRNSINNRERTLGLKDVYPGYHPIELYKCSAYMIREFNFDAKTFKPLPGFKVALWKYDYSGKGKEILVLAGENSSGTPAVFFHMTLG